MKKLAIVVSHPIQYYSPLFKILAKEIDLKVFYGFIPNAQQQGEAGFGEAFEWDLDLLSGYEYELLENVASKPTSSKFDGCNTPAIGHALSSFGATHVVTFGWHLKMYRQALHYCKKYKIPIAVRGDSILKSRFPLWKKLVKKLYYPFFLGQFDAFLSVGQRNREYLHYYDVPDRKIIFSPHAVDQEFWQVENARQSSHFTFLWVGKFIPLKRPVDVVQAFRQLLVDQPDLKHKINLVMVGTGPLFKEVKEITTDLPQITLSGFKNQQELRSSYAAADCLVLSSDSETWGLVVNEAFAAGLPAIVSDACGCVPDLIDQYTGKVFPAGNIRELKKQMHQLILEAGKKNFQNQRTRSLHAININYSLKRNIQSFNQFINGFPLKN
jgi:glycosyltransferase involved in cell wall biosynthesis